MLKAYEKKKKEVMHSQGLEELGEEIPVRPCLQCGEKRRWSDTHR